MDNFINTVKNFPIEQIHKNATKDNINKSEWNAIDSLKRDKTIVIKEADKGSAVVIMDRDHYESLCLAVLENSTYYAKQEKYDSTEILKKLDKCVTEHGDKLTSKEK